MMKKMSKRAALAIVLAVLVLLPMAAMAVELNVAPYLRTVEKAGESGIYVQIEDLTPSETCTVEMRLYAGDKLLQTKGITRKATAKGTLGGTFYTVGKSSSWSYTDWTAWDAIVPTRVEVTVGGETASKNVAFNASEWAAFDGTRANAGLEGLFLRTVEKAGESGIYFNATNLPTDVASNVKVELYAGNELLQTKTITRTASAKGTLGGTFYTVGTSSSWTQTDWTAYDHIVPTHVVLYIDDVRMASEDVTFTAEEWVPFPGTLPQPVEPDPTPVPTPKPTPVPDVNTLPSTGDSSNMMLFALLLAVSAAGMLLLRRRAESR